MDVLAQRFETDRPHLEVVAYRMLGSRTEADDAVQEAWLRLAGHGADGVDNLRGWLTTVVARVCLDMLRTRTSRREEPLAPDEVDRAAAGPGPEGEAVLADSVGAALLVVLDTLAPAERLAFVLHDLFAVPFDEIADIIGRSPAAARQLASRGRRRVQGGQDEGGGPEGGGADDQERRREVVAAFLAASRGGDFAALVALLDPDVVLRADAATVATGAEPEVRGAAAVAETFAGRARAARLALVDGTPGLVWYHQGSLRVVFAFAVDDGQVTGIELISDPEHLARLAVVPVPHGE